VLVIRLGALGDVVRTRFAFAGVRALYPRAHIEWLVEDRAAAGLVGLPGLDGRVEVPRRKLRARHPLVALATLRAFAAQLRERRYDLSIDFHGVFRSGFLAWAAKIPVRVGYGPPLAKEASHWFQTLRAPVRAAHVSRFERNAALVRFLGGEGSPCDGRVAIAMGGHVRVGLEDNLYLDPERKILATNVGLVERLIKISRAMGREIATPTETRTLLGLPERNFRKSNSQSLDASLSASEARP
jgi:hypothetical protein